MVFEKTGRTAINVIEEFGNIFTLAGQTILFVIKGSFSPKLVMDQSVRIGIGSLPVAVTTAAAVGMVFAIQISLEFVKFGAGKFVGGVMGIAIARELAPALTGVVIAARVGAAMAAEIGTMKVTEQVDALTAMGANPIKYLVVPRFIAATLMLPVLTIFCMVVGYYGGYVIATSLIKINANSYLSSTQSLLTYMDIYGGLAKTLFFGMIVSIVACYKGLNTKGGAKGVGEATTSAVVISLISIFIANYFLSLLFFK